MPRDLRIFVEAALLLITAIAVAVLSLGPPSPGGPCDQIVPGSIAALLNCSGTPGSNQP